MHDVSWLVPVVRDRDGTLLATCVLDGTAWKPPAGLALYCPDCRAVVGDVLPGTAGLADVDGLPDPAADLLLRREASLAAAHALDPAARRTGAPGETRYAAAR